jgi:hypothetical protein
MPRFENARDARVQLDVFWRVLVVIEVRLGKLTKASCSTCLILLSSRTTVVRLGRLSKDCERMLTILLSVRSITSTSSPPCSQRGPRERMSIFPSDNLVIGVLVGALDTLRAPSSPVMPVQSQMAIPPLIAHPKLVKLQGDKAVQLILPVWGALLSEM